MVHDEALHPSDLAVDSMDAFMAFHLGLAQRDGVAEEDRRPVTQAHADPHARG